MATSRASSWRRSEASETRGNSFCLAVLFESSRIVGLSLPDKFFDSSEVTHDFCGCRLVLCTDRTFNKLNSSTFYSYSLLGDYKSHLRAKNFMESFMVGFTLTANYGLSEGFQEVHVLQLPIRVDLIYMKVKV